MLRVALVSGSGRYLMPTLEADGRLLTIRDGMGAWEMFTLFNRSRTTGMPRHGDRVVLMTWRGQFVSASGGGGGAVRGNLGWIEDSCIFTVERIDGAGEIRSRDRVALRTLNGSFLSSQGTTPAVGASANRADAAATFSLIMFQPQLLRLRAANRSFVTAENGGGGPLSGNRNNVGLWETFSIVNLSRGDREIRNDDVIALQTWNGQFVECQGAAVRAAANRAIETALFRVRAASPGAVAHDQPIRLISIATGRFLSLRAGVLAADVSVETPECVFRVELAQEAGMEIRWAPDGSALATRPFAALPSAVSGARRVVLVHYHNRLAPPLPVPMTQLQEAVFGRAPSLVSWLKANSGGIFSVTSSGVYGPIRIPDGPSDTDPDPGMDAVLTAMEEAGVPLAAFSRDGTWDLGAYRLFEISTWGVGGQNRPREGISRGGFRFSGFAPWIGVSNDLDESSRMVLCHEASHNLMDVQDRYGIRRPIKGDVSAWADYEGEWEDLRIERIGGPGPIRSGDRLMLRSASVPTKWISVSKDAPHFVNLEEQDAGGLRIFTIQAVVGGPGIEHGGAVTLRSSSARFITAELGGNSALTANRTEARSWEQFTILSLSGSRPIASGDVIRLRTSGGFYVVAEDGSRDRPRGLEIDRNDQQRGYIWGGGEGMGGGFDNASANYKAVLLALYDRIRLGWARPRYLTPENRGSYLVRPFLTSRDAFILFDPENPLEWYTLENRQYRDDVDEVPSSGIVISWVCLDEGYWRWWHARANDPEFGIRCPAVISAAAPDVPPNMMARPPVLSPVTRINDPHAAFTHQELVIPRGNGDPSRFHVSFHGAGSGGVSFCIR